MIPKITPKFIQKIGSMPSKVVPREVEIVSKNGKDYVKDEFISGVPRVSIIEIIRDLLSSL